MKTESKPNVKPAKPISQTETIIHGEKLEASLRKNYPFAIPQGASVEVKQVKSFEPQGTHDDRLNAQVLIKGKGFEFTLVVTADLDGDAVKVDQVPLIKNGKSNAASLNEAASYATMMQHLSLESMNRNNDLGKIAEDSKLNVETRKNVITKGSVAHVRVIRAGISENYAVEGTKKGDVYSIKDVSKFGTTALSDV